MTRSALVIGASSPGGLGEAVARRLWADGFELLLAGRDTARLAALAAELDARLLPCDLLDEASIRGLADAAGAIDVLVNAAGTTLGRSILRIERSEIEAQFAVHVTANILLLKHFGPVMTPGGSIILFSSLTGERAGEGIVAYASAKAALNHVVRVAALEFAKLDLRVNAVAPGFVDTPMTNGFLAVDRLNALYCRETAVGRLATPDQVAAAVSYLATPDCFATGTIMAVDGGAQLMRLPRSAELKG